MKLNNLIINEEIYPIINLLKFQLEDPYLFSTVKENGRNIQINCPFHKGGRENKPSFGINIESGKCHCFTCGWAGSFDVLISQLYGKNDRGKFGLKWLQKNFNNLTIEERKVPIIEPRKKAVAKQKEYLKKEDYLKFKQYHEYLKKRGIPKRIASYFDLGFEKETSCITFPILDENGKCVFIAKRSTLTKFYTYPKEVEKPVYALDKILKNNYKKVWIVEGMFNCLTLWTFGIPAVALNGLGSENQYKILRNSNIRHFVLALDPDIRGKNAQKRLRKELNNKVITEILYENDTEDINDLQEKVLKLKEIL